MGQRLAHRYRIDKLLGQGGFGKVFLAHDEQLPGEPVCVVKQLNPQVGTDATTGGINILDTAQRLFELEAKTLYRLGEHPQIPRLLAHFEEAGQRYLVQDYIPGHSLAEAFARGPLSLDTTQKYLQQLLTVLAAVHHQQVIHRDIKPSNILCRQGASEQLVLIDFGAVKALQTATTRPTVAIGSLGYMAPEQQAGRPCFGSDLYSLGMVIIHGLTGRHPMGFDVPVSCADVGLALPPFLAQFLDRLVHLDHRQRYHTAGEALKAWCAFNPCNLQETTEAALETVSSTTQLPETTLNTTTLSTTDSTDLLSVTHPSPEAHPSIQRPSPETVAPGPTASARSTSYSHQTYRNRQALLNKVRRFWIEGVLERSLHGQVLLTLGLEERPDAIAPPWQITYASPGQAPRPLPPGTQASHVFNAIGEGRTLVILGEPGAGKTTTLLSLARSLLEQVDQHQRLPVIFNLSSWLNQPIEQWLVQELNSKYQVPKAIGHRWVIEQHLLLLLDGLDEVALERRAACVTALNQFHQDYGPEMVVCSRIRDYEALPEKLSFQAALFLRPLTDAQILAYLDRPDHGLTGLKSLLEKDAAVEDSRGSLFELARSPLILNIMVLTFQGVAAEEIFPNSNCSRNRPEQQHYQQQLFDAYIQRMLAHRPDSTYRPEQIKHWLGALARRLVATSETIFLIERMQPDWLSPPLRRLYVVGLWGIFFAIATTLGSQVLAWDRLTLGVLVGGIICSRMFGVSRIAPAETLRWSWKEARNNLVVGLTLGPLIGWCLKIGIGLVFGHRPCLLNGSCLPNHSLIGLTFGATLGLTYGLIRGLSGKQVGNTSRANAGIWQSARNSTLFALVAMVALYIPGTLIGNTQAAFWAVTGLAFGFAAGGGEALIKHGLLRLLLTLDGVIPWHYSKFLDYATASIFLQNVGGGYLFIHRLVLEHFASLPLTAEKRH